MQVKFKRLTPDTPVPVYQTSGSVAFDFCAAESVTIPPRETVLIPTGLVVETPANYALIVSVRSSLPRKKGLQLSNGIGVIDQDYCGPTDEVKILVHSFLDTPVTIEKGERIAQGMFVRVDRAELIEDSEMQNADRGGFGSTGGYTSN